jgi:hypothetical protein
MRSELADRLDVEPETASQTYYAYLMFSRYATPAHLGPPGAARRHKTHFELSFYGLITILIAPSSFFWNIS